MYSYKQRAPKTIAFWYSVEFMFP